MAPKQSTSSNEKQKKSGRTKENSKASDRQDEEEKRLVEEFLATSLLGQECEAAGRRTPASCLRPDVPPCDGCSKQFSGTMQCSRCESVFYCGRDCQVSHWSSDGGHKTECRQLRRRNEATAQRVLGDFKAFRDWRELDVAGAYNAAVRQGLHDKIREVLELDSKGAIIHRLVCGHPVISYAQCVISVLFRGLRAEGKEGARSPDYNCVDGRRIKGYVCSHPEAVHVWLLASVQLLRAVTDPSTLRNPFLHRAAMDASLEVWEGWPLVFTCSTSARAILAPTPSDTECAKGAVGVGGGGGESTEQRRKRSQIHIRRIAKALGEAICLISNEPGATMDANGVMEGILLVVAAMVHLRAQEFGVGVNVEELLSLEGATKRSFQGIALLVAKRTIEKGGQLDLQEARTAGALSWRAMGLS